MKMLSICISCKNFGYDGDLNTYYCKDKHDNNFGTLDGCRFFNEFTDEDREALNEE